MSVDKPISMVAPPPDPPRLRPLADLARERNVSAPILAGLSRAHGWAPDKQVTPEEFEAAVTAYGRRPMGGTE